MSGREKVNILMVDDQPAKLLSYEAILDELDEVLIKANSGQEALEHLLKTDIGVILMDVSMPDLDGFELADMIRQHPRFHKIPIIFISAVHMTDMDRLRGYERGAVDYIAVPVIAEVLRAKVHIFAELHRKTRQLEALNNELHRLSRTLISTQDEERRRVARELHDGLGQDLVAAKMMLDSFTNQYSPITVQQAAAELTQVIDRSIQQVRSMSHLLHPPLLDEVGLRSALQWYVEGLAKRSGIETSLDIQPAEFPRLSAEMETAIFRIIQEALTNVFRHSGAHKGRVTLVQENGRVIVTVADDGKGIESHIAQLRPGSIGIGVGGMVQRVKQFGGELRLSNANPGTVVEVVLPFSAPVSLEANATA